MQKPCRPTMVATAVAIGIAILGGCTREFAANDTVIADPGTTTGAVSTAAPTQPSDPPASPSTDPVPTTATPVTTANPELAIDGETVATGAPNPGDGPITLDALRTATDPDGDSESADVLAWGDVDGDGDQDAVVVTQFCGASCGTELDLVLNDDGTPTLIEYPGNGAFAPWYNGGGAAQSSVTGVTIDGATIVLTGTGLCGDVLPSETDEPGMCNYTTVRTATYQFVDGVLAPVSIEPEPG